MRNRYRVLSRQPGRKEPLRKLRRRWEDNIKIHLKEMTYDSAGCIHLAQDKNELREGSYENSYRASGSVKSGEFLD
jgi:hypothetical protein